MYRIRKIDLNSENKSLLIFAIYIISPPIYNIKIQKIITNNILLKCIKSERFNDDLKIKINLFVPFHTIQYIRKAIS